MSTINNGTLQGVDSGKNGSPSDNLALFLKVFSGEVLTAFARRSVTMDKIITRTIASGKSAAFPVIGRAAAFYLAPGESVLDKQTAIKNTEKVITIDGLLAASTIVFDIQNAMAYFDSRQEYANQLGESLAITVDQNVLAEIAILTNTGTDENLLGLGHTKVYAIDDATDPATFGKAILSQLMVARGAFTDNYVLTGDRYAYVEPETYSAILAALMPNSAQYSALGDLEKGVLSNVGGWTIVEVPHLSGSVDPKHTFPTTGDVTKENVVVLLAHKSAVGMVKLKDVKLERERKAEYQGDLIVSTLACGVGGLRPEAAAAIVLKASGE